MAVKFYRRIQSSLKDIVGIFRANGRTEDNHFLSNGATLLQEVISSCDGNTKPIQVFSFEELRYATNNFNIGQILFRECFNTFYYRGAHENINIVVKRNEHPQSECAPFLNEFMNEIVILSQINHRSTLNLIGCCLESQCPMLVFEWFPFRYNLSECIQDEGLLRNLSWECRLRIASEVAEALAYLHLAKSKSIVHCNLMPSTIWLDELCNIKVVDFSLSESIPKHEPYLQTDIIRGTAIYMDPEILLYARITGKSDVYSFGMVLLEFLCGIRTCDIWEMKKSSNMNEYPEMLISYFKMLCIDEEGATCLKKASAELAFRCIQIKPDERPTMKEVCLELTRIKKTCVSLPSESSKGK